MQNSKEYFDKVASDWDNMRNDFFPEDVRIEAYKIANIEASVSDMESVCPFITEREIKMIKIDWKPKT